MTTPETETPVPDEAKPGDVTAMSNSGYVDPNEGNTEYLVRLLFRIPAKDPAEAVEKYLEQIMTYGLRNWSYRVEIEETGEMYHVDGYGKEIDSTSPPEDDD